MPNADWRRPSPLLRRVRHLEAAAGTLLAVVIAGVLAGLSSLTAGVIAVGCGLAAGVVADVVMQRRVGAWAYCEREDDLLVRRGLMVRRLSVVPYGRMQFVDVTAGPAERAFKLATVRLHTAAAASDARIPGLSTDAAARLRDQ